MDDGHRVRGRSRWRATAASRLLLRRRRLRAEFPIGADRIEQLAHQLLAQHLHHVHAPNVQPQVANLHLLLRRLVRPLRRSGRRGENVLGIGESLLLDVLLVEVQVQVVEELDALRVLAPGRVVALQQRAGERAGGADLNGALARCALAAGRSCLDDGGRLVDGAGDLGAQDLLDVRLEEELRLGVQFVRERLRVGDAQRVDVSVKERWIRIAVALAVERRLETLSALTRSDRSRWCD